MHPVGLWLKVFAQLPPRPSMEGGLSYKVREVRVNHIHSFNDFRAGWNLAEPTSCRPVAEGLCTIATPFHACRLWKLSCLIREGRYASIT
jgi:hypothetical protein